MTKKELCDIILPAVRVSVPVQVLRGLDVHARDAGDVDLIVPPGKARTACLLAVTAALECKWFLVGFRTLGYVSSMTLLKPGKTGDALVKLDFIDGLAWRGIARDEARANPFDPHWEDLHNGWRDARVLGALTFVQKIMAAGFVSDNEWERIASAGTTAEYVASVAARMRVPLSKNEILALRISMTRKWRLRAASCGVSGPVTFLAWARRVANASVSHKLQLGLRSGLVVGVSGPDGSGKSTLLSRFISAFAASGAAPQMVHLLPKWIPMPHQIFRRHRTASNYTKPYAEPPVKSRASGLARLGYYVCAFAITRAWLALSAARGKVIVLDRSVVDFASDLTRARIPAGLLPHPMLRLITPNGQLFYLNVSPATAVARKGELTLDRATSLQTNYLAIAQTLRVVVLDADASQDAVFEQFLTALSREYVRRIAPDGHARDH